ncbi:uncharacterized protein RCC_05020 [Ramularia collo-cygni]|uniref:Ubiquitin-like domain-containing protein n=1 Tax=Ramularia collo-cygni TaxID=112498 RepID=A0A2D3V977_9PEZI|nr:uncharacterized protein RCC_05020 [Ramularia collo-cygni]CZT19174.1 uncharacterized protein RCC_05020 [Ramularia collo-cygni]
MSINVAVSIPLEAAVAVRRMRYTFESIETNEPGLENALATVCSAVIEAIRSLPYSLSMQSPPIESSTLRLVSDGSSEVQSLRSSQRSDPFEIFSPVLSSSSNSSTSIKEDKTPLLDDDDDDDDDEEEEWGSPPSVGFQNDFDVEIQDVQGSIYQVSVYGDLTVMGLQTKVERLFRLPADQQKLVWRGYRLNQLDATLSSYGVQPNETITVHRHLLPAAPMPPASHGIYFEDAQFEFFLQTLSGKVIPIEARDETTTAEIAGGISDKLGIAEKLQRIIYRGTVIYDGFERARGKESPIWTMEEIGIGHASIVQLFIVNTSRE